MTRGVEQRSPFTQGPPSLNPKPSPRAKGRQAPVRRRPPTGTVTDNARKMRWYLVVHVRTAKGCTLTTSHLAVDLSWLAHPGGTWVRSPAGRRRLLPYLEPQKKANPQSPTSTTQITRIRALQRAVRNTHTDPADPDRDEAHLHWTGTGHVLSNSQASSSSGPGIPPTPSTPLRPGVAYAGWGRTPGDGPAQPEFGGAPTASFSKVQAVYLLARFRSGT